MKNLICSISQIASLEELRKTLKEETRKFLEEDEPLTHLEFDEEEMTLGISIEMPEDEPSPTFKNCEILDILEELLWGNLIEDIDPSSIDYQFWIDYAENAHILNYRIELNG
jgi:hypothetical protein